MINIFSDENKRFTLSKKENVVLWTDIKSLQNRNTQLEKINSDNQSLVSEYSDLVEQQEKEIQALTAQVKDAENRAMESRKSAGFIVGTLNPLISN